MKVAPALAASSAWLAEKHSVTLTLRPSAGQRLAGLQAVAGQRHLDAEFSAIFGKDRRFAHHAVIVGRGHFGRDRTVDDAADFRDHLDDVAAGLEDQRGIGGDAVQQAQVVEFADILDVGGIDKEFHGCSPSQVRALALRALAARRRAVITGELVAKATTWKWFHGKCRYRGPAQEDIGKSRQDRCVLLPMPAEAPYSYAVPQGMDVAAGDDRAGAARPAAGGRRRLGWRRMAASIRRSCARSASEFDCPPLSRDMRRFVDWVANYTLSPPGMVARMVLRAPGAFDPEPPMEGLRYTGSEPDRMTPARGPACWSLREDGMAWTRIGPCARGRRVRIGGRRAASSRACSTSVEAPAAARGAAARSGAMAMADADATTRARPRTVLRAGLGRAGFRSR